MFSPGHGTENFQGNDSFMSLSPSSPVHSLNMPQSHASPFLPGYLLGDHQSQHYTVTSPRLWSSMGSQSPGQKAGGQSGTMSTGLPGPGSMRREFAKGKVGGPPVKSLYATPTTSDMSHIGTPEHGRTHLSPTLRQMSTSTPAPPITGLFHTPGGPRGDPNLNLLNQKQALPVSPAQIDPFYTQDDLKSSDVLNETWVTVFGFPPGATSFILQQFSQYGTVLKHVSPPECNWMHIHYMSKLQAKKALSKDGKVFGGCLRIGVTHCIEKRIMEDKENSYASPGMDSSVRSLSDLNQSNLMPIRPLTAAYVASRGEYEVLKDKPTPKRDAGLVSKLKEYMFGY
uniref:Nucleoporin NUP53 n=1 Tax=Arion vulgaris TaxID=1028688 RepID=A0A0B6YB24_9EUPU